MSTAVSMSAATPGCSARRDCASPPTIPAARTCRPACPDIRSTRRSAAPLGVDQNFNRLQVSAGATVDRTDYQYSKLTDGTSTTNDDRNFNQYGGVGRVSYDLMPGLKPFGEVRAKAASHDLWLDRSGYQRDSSGGYVKGRHQFRTLAAVDRRNRASARRRATYDDPRLQSSAGPAGIGLAGVDRDAADHGKILRRPPRSTETTLPGVSGVLTHTYTVEVDHDFRRWLTAIGKFTWGTQQYQGDDRCDKIYSLSGDLIYKMNRSIWLRGTLRRDWLDSNLPGNSTASTVVMLGVRVQH